MDHHRDYPAQHCQHDLKEEPRANDRGGELLDAARNGDGEARRELLIDELIQLREDDI